MGRRSRAPRQPPSAEAEADAPYRYGYATREACVKASSRPPGASVTRDAPDHRERATRNQVAGRRRQTSGTGFNLVNGAYVRHARRNVGLSPWAQFAGPGGSPPARTTALSLRRSPRYPVILLSSPRSTRRDARKWRAVDALAARRRHATPHPKPPPIPIRHHAARLAREIAPGRGHS